MIQEQQTQSVMYRYHHSSDIHEVVVHGSERSTINGMFEVMRWVYDHPSPHQLTRVLLVKDGSTMPLASFMSNIRDMLLRHPMINARTPARFAFVSERHALVRIAQNIFKPIPVINTVHFYRHPQYNEAFEWLKS
jgi:hypothetical protein